MRKRWAMIGIIGISLALALGSLGCDNPEPPAVEAGGGDGGGVRGDSVAPPEPEADPEQPVVVRELLQEDTTDASKLEQAELKPETSNAAPATVEPMKSASDKKAGSPVDAPRESRVYDLEGAFDGDGDEMDRAVKAGPKRAPKKKRKRKSANQARADGEMPDRLGTKLPFAPKESNRQLNKMDEQLVAKGFGDKGAMNAMSKNKSDKSMHVFVMEMAKQNRAKEREAAAEAEKPQQALDGFENRAYRGERFTAKPMTATLVDPKSTFAIDVDTGGYTLARARLRKGYRPKPEDVRVEEFLNYFHYDYPEPQQGEFSVNLEAAPDPFNTAANRHLIRIGVKGKAVPDSERPAAHLTFLVDVSGSMFGPDKLGLAIESLDLVTRNLRSDDTIAVVTYAKGAKVRLWPAGAKERDLAALAIAALEPGGSSSLDEGLSLAYEVASTHYYAGHINRVVLLGDGRANVGETQPGALLDSVAMGVEDGVMLSTIGFGAKSFNDRVMEQLADRGDGNYFFVDSYREAQRVFGDRLCGTLFAIAKDVKIQVEFNPESVVQYRLLGYENRKLEHSQFRDDTVDAGEIGAGHSVTALYEIELTPTPAITIAVVNIRHKIPGANAAAETNYQLFTEELRRDIREASADFKFAAAVARFAQIARGDARGGADRISLVKEIATEGVVEPTKQPDRVEFLALLEEATPYYVN